MQEGEASVEIQTEVLATNMYDLYKSRAGPFVPKLSTGINARDGGGSFKHRDNEKRTNISLCETTEWTAIKGTEEMG